MPLTSEVTSSRFAKANDLSSLRPLPNQYFYVAIAGTGLSGQGLSTGEVMMSNNQQVSGDPVSGYVTASTGVIPLSTWTHIAVTLSSTAGTKIYIKDAVRRIEI